MTPVHIVKQVVGTRVKALQNKQDSAIFTALPTMERKDRELATSPSSVTSTSVEEHGYSAHNEPTRKAPKPGSGISLLSTSVISSANASSDSVSSVTSGTTSTVVSSGGTTAKLTASTSPAVTSLLANKRFSTILSRLVRENHDRIIIKQNKEGSSKPTYVQISVKSPAASQQSSQQTAKPTQAKPVTKEAVKKPNINIIEVPPNLDASNVKTKDIPSSIKIIPVKKSVISNTKDSVINSGAKCAVQPPKNIMIAIPKTEPPKPQSNTKPKGEEPKSKSLVSLIFPNPDMIQNDFQSALNLAHFLPVSPPNDDDSDCDSSDAKDPDALKANDSKSPTKTSSVKEEPNANQNSVLKSSKEEKTKKQIPNKETETACADANKKSTTALKVEKSKGLNKKTAKQEPHDSSSAPNKISSAPSKVQPKTKKKINAQKVLIKFPFTAKTVSSSKKSVTKPDKTLKKVKQSCPSKAEKHEEQEELGNLEIVEAPVEKQRKSLLIAKPKATPKNAAKSNPQKQKPTPVAKEKASTTPAAEQKRNQNKRRREKTLSKTKSVSSLMKEENSPEISQTKKRPKEDKTDEASSLVSTESNAEDTKNSLTEHPGPLITITGFSESVEATPEEILDELDAIDKKAESSKSQTSLEPEPALTQAPKTETEHGEDVDETECPTVKLEKMSEDASSSQTDSGSIETIQVLTTPKDSNASGDVPKVSIISGPTTPVSAKEKTIDCTGRLQLSARTSLLRRIFAERGEGSPNPVLIQKFPEDKIPELKDSSATSEEPPIDMKALDEKIKRLIDREVEGIESLTPEGERTRAVRFKHRERERHRRRTASPGTPKLRSSSEVTEMRFVIKQEKDAALVNQEEVLDVREDVAQSKSHPSLPEKKSPPQVPRRSKSQPAIGSRIVTKIRMEALLAEAYSQMLAAWSDYIHMDATRMRQAEIQNATDFQYTEESLDMIRDEDLYVWQLVEDLAKPYSISTL